ncbi:MAG: hypothetical protein AAF705_13630 [Bacteroidota bacterium]
MRRLLFTLAVILIGANGIAQEEQLPSCVKEFLDLDKDKPFGERNVNAPKGLEQFGQLTGVWEMVTHAERNGKWYTGWPAIWTWKYVLDGSNILDYFYRSKENTPPTGQPKMDIHAYNLRVYDKETDSWSITWAANNSGEYRYKAEFKNGEIWMVPADDKSPKMRIIFSEITKDSFKWHVETPNKDGEWTHNQYLMAKRLM